LVLPEEVGKGPVMNSQTLLYEENVSDQYQGEIWGELCILAGKGLYSFEFVIPKQWVRRTRAPSGTKKKSPPSNQRRRALE
jgi:hypothetical protein